VQKPSTLHDYLPFCQYFRRGFLASIFGRAAEISVPQRGLLEPLRLIHFRVRLPLVQCQGNDWTSCIIHLVARMIAFRRLRKR
jgi:hypothetical protein